VPSEGFYFVLITGAIKKRGRGEKGKRGKERKKGRKGKEKGKRRKEKKKERDPILCIAGFNPSRK
jgi:hypothetical protein